MHAAVPARLPVCPPAVPARLPVCPPAVPARLLCVPLLYRLVSPCVRLLYRLVSQCVRPLYRLDSPCVRLLYRLSIRLLYRLVSVRAPQMCRDVLEAMQGGWLGPAGGAASDAFRAACAARFPYCAVLGGPLPAAEPAAENNGPNGPLCVKQAAGDTN